jgi:ATP-dependent Clp protease adaptor protein ClpS
MRESKNTVMEIDDLRIRMGAPKRGGDAGSQLEGELMVADPALKPKRPPMYKVVLLNDDYTPMDFVVMVLESVFHKEHQEALEIMLQVHNKGAAVVGIFTRDVAETKAGIVVEHARINEYPLQCTVEKE